MLNFDKWDKAVSVRNQILNASSQQDISTALNNALAFLREQEASSIEIMDFFKHLETLFLATILTEGQDHSKTLQNAKIARQLLKTLIANIQKIK